MFRGSQNQFDDVIAKATDETLTSENWEYMMDAWERINESGENGPRDAAAALIKRLAHRNANVQLYTLELANAFSQNCGPKMHRELASRSFTDALLRLAGDRSTHAAVKSKILERMGEWTEMFSKEPDLGIMEQAYHKLKSQNPNLAPPSKPQKREISELDRLKEEEELQMALAISLKERQSAVASKSASKSPESSTSKQATQATQAPKPQAAPHTTAATVSRVRALYDFVPTETGELAFKKGDVIAVLESVYKDWWKGSLRGQVGIFPLNYVEKLSDPTAEELQKEAQMEAEVFAEIKNVEKLLALLSTSDAGGQDNDEITRLYHSTLAIRPKLIELIGKYSQKKDDFVSLNEKFIKARRDYEALLESSMAAPPAGLYGRPPPPSQTPFNGYDSYAPPGGQPPQQRYFSPGPSQPAASPHLGHSAYQQPPHHVDPPYPVTAQNTGSDARRQSNYGNITAPGQSEPAHPGAAQYYQNLHQQPPPQQQQPPQPQQGRPSHPADPTRPSTTDLPTHYPPHAHHQGGPPPQELATSVYDSPLNDRPPHGGFGQGALEGRVSPAGASGYYYGNHNHSTHNLPRPLTVGTQSQGGLAPGSHDVTPVSPPSAHASLPGQYPGAYPNLTPGRGGETGGYTAYPGPARDEGGPGGPGGPQDYYRNNELFLPQGSRA